MKFFKHILYLPALLLTTQGAFAQISKAGSETAVNTTTAKQQRAASIGTSSSGAYVVIWESEAQDGDDGGIYFKLFDSSGSLVLAETLMNSFNTVNAQSFANVSMNSAGKFVTTWMSEDGASDTDGWGIRYSFKDASGANITYGRANSTKTGNQKFPSVALSDNAGFVIAWENEGDISSRRYNSNGASLNYEFNVNTNTNGAQLYPDVAIDSDGDFVIVWQSDTTGGNFDIHAQRYNNAGVAQGTEFKVNTTEAHHQISPKVAMDDAGNFAVTWASYDQDGDDYGVYTRRFSSDGTALSSEVKVNTTSSGTQTHPAIDMGPEGTYIISWTSFNQDGDAAGIYAQAFSPTGSKKGAERLINTTTAAFQTLPALSMTGDADKALFAWQSGEPDSTNTQDGDDYGIFLQAFDVADMIDPVAVAQDLTVYLDASGNAVITGADLDNGSTDNVGVTSYMASKTAFDCDDLGDDNTVTLTVADAAGNESTDTSVITVLDTISPVVVTQDIIITLNSEGVASFSDQDIDDGSTDNCGIASYVASNTVFSNSDLGENEVTLTVTDASGNDKSATATVTVVKMDQTITFSPLSAVTYGDADFSLGATASSGLSVNYSSSNTSVAVINGTTVEIIGVGTTNITASQAGDANYKAAADVQQLLTVNELPITVTADDKSKDFGDADPGFTFSVTSGALVGSDAFTGDLTRDAGESLGQYDITVGTLSAGSNYDLTYIQGVFEIFDLTDPVFTSGNSFSVAEGATGTVFTAMATDLRTVSYALGTGGDESLFNISDGAVSFKNAPDFENPLDGNTDNIYAISVEASDGVNTVTQAVSITVTDVDEIDPVFTSGTTVDFAENGEGTAYTAVATDANTITYSLGTSNDESDFNIDGSTGVVTFKFSPDFESPADGDTNNDYVIDVKANDGLNEAVQTVTITVTDVDEIDPVFTSGTAVDFAENGEGTAYTAVATDANTITYSLGTGNDESDFNIDGSTGVVTFKSSPDFESPADGDTNNDYVIHVKANDGLNEAVLTVTITVTDVDEIDPVFTSGTAVDFAENESGTAYTAVATDANTITYSLGTGNDESDFNIDGSTGVVTFKFSPDFESPADGDTNNDYVIDVKANDGLNEAVQTVTITVTDVDEIDPVFTSGMAVDFAENGEGTAYTAVATDANAITYSLGTSNDESDFNIDGSTGIVTFKSSPDFESPGDGDTNNDYVIEVKANDGLNEAVLSVTITVTDVDEIDPVFTSGTAVDFAENGVGTAYTAVATDANAITYSLGTSNDESDFNIDVTTGIVTFKSSPDFENPTDGDTNNDYVIDVKANDGLNEAVLSVTITVTDVDEIDPVFTSGTAVNFAENGEGTAYTAAATDANAITYSLGAGNDESDFNIDVTTGIVTFKSSPDFENPTDGDTNNDYVIEVKANDGLNEAVQTVTITVTDVDEIDPVFTSGTAVDFAENGMGTAYAAVATDANVITYSLGSGNDESLFNIDGSTGIVTFIVSPDFENPTDGNTDNAYVIAVKANDGLNEVSQIVTITVTDVFEDPARPNLIGSDPLDDATDFAGTTITLTFDRNVFKGSGTIEVLDASDDAQLFSKGVNHADISINGAVVTIDMKSALALDKDVYLNVPATAFKDVNDGFFLGITDKTTLNFSTPSSPVLVSSTPADDAVEFGGTTIDLTFDRTMSKGNGLITLFDASDDSQVWSVGVNNPNVTINGSMVSLSVGSLSEDKAYYLNIGASALKDTNGRSYAGISDNSTLNFASLTSPVLLASNPMDNAIDFSGTSISLTFDSDMSKGAGVITLFDASDDSHVWSVGVNNPNVAITGTVITLNTGSLPLDKDFYLNVGASALMDAQGLKYAGISDKTTLNFSGQTSPQLISSSPADGATGYDGTTVALTFDRNMLKGAGTVSLSDASTDAQVWARGINHPDITINGATVTFAVGTLPIDKEFYVNIASTALKDATGLFYAGIADKTTLNFFGRTSPVLVSSTPEDDAIDFDATSIVLNFDKDVSKGAGTISLKDASDDSEVWGVGVNHPNVVVSGSTVTLNVGALPLDEDFYLNIGSQAFKDNQDAFYSGISDKTTLNFSGPTTPKLISSNPADDATGFSGTSMTLTFDRNVVKGYGAIAIFDASDDSKLKGAGVNVGAITINGAVVTINLGGGLPADKDVYLNIAATAFKDADNRFYAGISDKTTLNFDTNTPVPSRNPSDLTQEIAGGQESGIWLYPNPATNKITIDLSAAGEAPDVQITDATGAGKFLKEKVEQRLLTIDVSQYAGGIYIALVRNQDGTISRQKFMIRR